MTREDQIRLADDVCALAERIAALLDADVPPVEFAMLLADVDPASMREAMRIVREELIPAAVEAEVDRDAAARGRYLNEEEIAELRRASEARRPRFSAADRERLIATITEVAAEVAAEGVKGEAIERRLRARLRGRARS
jgi:hypothetical protein